MNSNKAASSQQLQVRSNHRNDLNQVEKSDYCQYFRVKGLHRHYDLYKAIGNYNEASNNDLKKSLRTLLIHSNRTINQVNRKQDRLFEKYRTLDDIKHKIFFTEYQQQLEYFKERLKSKDDYKDLNEKSIAELDVYRNAKKNLKETLVKRLQLDDEFEAYAAAANGHKCSITTTTKNKQDIQIPKEFTESVALLNCLPQREQINKVIQKRSVDFKLPALKSIEKMVKKEADFGSFQHDYQPNKKLSLVVVEKRKEKNIVCAYKLDRQSNLVSIEAPKRKDFRLHLDKMKQYRMERMLESEREKIKSYGYLVKNFFSKT